MSFNANLGPSYQRGAYSVIPNSEQKTALSLSEALIKWHDNDEMKYHPGVNGQTSYYYSNSQQPEGLLETGQHFVAHLMNPEKQALHRQTIDAVVSDLKKQTDSAVKGDYVAKDFIFRKMLGQPLSVGALRNLWLKQTQLQPRNHLASLPLIFLERLDLPDKESPFYST